VAHFTTERVAADGRRVHVSVAASPMRDAQGRIFGVSKILRDVTALRQHELEIDRLSRLYAALSHVNQAIVVTAEQNALFEKVCRALVESGGFHMAWVGWHEPATERILPVASWGDDTGYLSGIRVYADQRAEGLGPSGTAFREARPYICNDMLADPATLPWRSEIARRGFRASAVFPIREAGAVRGTLSVYADEPHFFQDREVALLMEAADDVSFALENFQRDAARRAVERTLREERDFSDAVLNSLPGVLYLYDEHGRFLRWNHNFERVSGYSPEEIVAMHPLDFYRGDDRARVAARIEEVFARGESSVEADFVGKDGQRTPYFFTGVLTEVGGQRCLVGVGIDIAERRRAEAARTLIEGRYRTLFEHAPDGILIADPHGVYVDANASVCTLLDYRPEELIGLSAADIVHTSEQVEIAPALATIHARGSYHREWRFKRRDGTKVAAEVTATLLPDGNVLAMLRDVTERNAAEAALRELNETLEHKVVERTGQLQAALVRAESADKLKSAFLATMSHELRTPLNSIIGFTGILLQGLAGPLTAEQSKQLTMVRGSGRHLLDLINDVLDLSKIEADQLLVRTERFALGASLERALATVRPLADKKGLRLCAELSDDLDEMVSDQRRVEQILINLLNNAIKFTDSGTVTLRAERLPRSPLHARPRLRVEVLDTGIGIKPEDLGRLFQPFSQIDTGLSRVHEGTGLGLAICRRLAGLLGGEIGARSNRPNGSVFTVILPLMER